MKAAVYFKNRLAGILEKVNNDEYVFEYSDDYINDRSSESISLTLPKSIKTHYSKILFPFFFGLLSEGTNKKMQCSILKIDEEDHFTRLIKTADLDTIGAVTVREIT